ncbi:hypothetical protein NECAME_06764 [Necator americanus]|uniref:MARVEL domain-containing protein n=1 Tax=Necator americanus TaxID=51031 RepID=W2TRI1_NECAM|nr:hypothetical protein NECAME_06764 [Necator americanus]ETN84665.1 hypothetical protein NECAME_06764 [Necator americanus]
MVARVLMNEGINTFIIHLPDSISQHTVSAYSTISGSSLIWFTAVLSLLVDLFIITLLLFELEKLKIPIRGVSHTSLEGATSLALSIFHFISIWLCFNSEKFTKSGWFYVAAFFCFVNFVIHAGNFVVYLRAWMAEQRAARSTPNGAHEFPSYGSP